MKQLWKHLTPGCSFKDRINVLAVWTTFSQAFCDLQPQTVAPFFQKRIGGSAKGTHISGVLDYQGNALSNPPVQEGPWPELGSGREEPSQGHRVMCVWPPHTPVAHKWAVSPWCPASLLLWVFVNCSSKLWNPRKRSWGPLICSQVRRHYS